ncbi:MAG: DUF4097 family beta strand repeat-containing protein [Planctomycetota bacterium]
MRRGSITNGMRTLTGLGLVAVAGLLPTLSGCGAGRSLEYAIDVREQAPALALHVDNFRGDIEVRVYPDLERARIRSNVRVTGDVATDDQPEALDAIDVVARIEDGPGGRQTLRIASTSDRLATPDNLARILVQMPRCDGLYIKNFDGNVELVGVGGSMYVENHAGSIELRTNEVLDEPVTLLNTDGNIFVQMPKESSAFVDAESLNGKVFYRGHLGSTTRNHMTSTHTGQHFTGSLNGGEHRLTARTNAGHIRMYVMEEPTEYARLMTAWPNSPFDYTFLQGSRRHTRNLPDDHPEVIGPPDYEGYE